MNAQLLTLGYKSKSTGSRLSGATCEETIGCNDSSGDDFFGDVFLGALVRFGGVHGAGGGAARINVN